MDVLSHILDTFRLEARVFHNGQYCGEWQVDTSGAKKASFHVITHGTCELLLDKGSKHVDSLVKGDLVIFPRDLEHRIASNVSVTKPVNSIASIPFQEGLNSNGTGMVCGHLEFELQRNQYLFDLLPDYLVIHCDEAPWNKHLKPLIDVLMSESIQSNPGVQASLNRLSELFFMIVLREYLLASNETSGMVSAFHDTRMVKVLEAIYTNPEHDWTVEAMAQIATMSRSAFTNRFKELLGESPLLHLKRWRLQNAYRWLRDGEVTVTQAAEQCGYATEAAFSKAFKKEIGLRPGAAKRTNTATKKTD